MDPQHAGHEREKGGWLLEPRGNLHPWVSRRIGKNTRFGDRLRRRRQGLLDSIGYRICSAREVVLGCCICRCCLIWPINSGKSLHGSNPVPRTTASFYSLSQAIAEYREILMKSGDSRFFVAFFMPLAIANYRLQSRSYVYSFMYTRRLQNWPSVHKTRFYS